MYRLALILTGFLGAGCGLVDSSIADINLSLPAQDVVVDSADFQLASEETVPSVDCSADSAVCETAAASFCQDSGDCAASCSVQTQLCEFELKVGISQDVNLAEQSPELRELDGKVLIEVSITSFDYDIEENTLNTDVPLISLLVAPEGILDPENADAALIGTLGPIRAGVTDAGELNFGDEGQATLSSSIKSYETPFTLLAWSTLVLVAGDPVPEGRLELEVHVRATAGL